MLTTRRVISSALKVSVALTTAFWPILAKASYLELNLGDTLAIGTSFEDTRMLWSALIRLALGILILFLIVRLLTDSYALYMTSNADVQSSTIGSLWSVGTTLVAVLIASAVTPYAVDVFFNIIGNGLNLNFG